MSYFHGPIIFQAVTASPCYYSSYFEDVGITKKQWYEDVYPKVMAIKDEALKKRLAFMYAVRKSSAASAYTKALYFTANCNTSIGNLICPDSYCCEDCVTCIKRFFLLPFQLTALIIVFPFCAIAFYVPLILALLFDLLTCYRWRVTPERKMAAVMDAMNAHPECDNNLVNDGIKVGLEKLAKELNAKYPALNVTVTMVPTFKYGFTKKELTQHILTSSGKLSSSRNSY